MVIAGDLPPDPGVQTPAKQLRLSVDRVFGQNGVTQQARQVSWELVERQEAVRCLIRDRDRKFTERSG